MTAIGLNIPIMPAGDFMLDYKLMALSWRQPFGTAMLFGKIETRTWNTNYRGWVLICTSKREYDVNAVERICVGINTKNSPNLFLNMCKVMQKDTSTLDFNGYAIGIGWLSDSRPMKNTWEDEQRTFVQYREGLFCHIYENVRPIKPFPWKGTQGWKEVTPDIKEKIKFL